MKKILTCLILLSITLLSACSRKDETLTEEIIIDETNDILLEEEIEKTNGILSSFTSTDLEDNTVDQTVLEDYDLTLINVWATFCNPCIKEMPYLGELAEEYKDRKVQIIGIVSDALASDGSISLDQVELAKDIVSKTKANYIHILPSNDLYGILSQIYAVPTTFFVDKDGNQVGNANIKSMSKKQLKAAIDEALLEVNE